MNAVFTIKGEPKGKGRPRFTHTGHTYTPSDTEEYEEYVKLEYKRQCGGVFFPKGTALIMMLDACYGMPKRISQLKRTEMLSGKIRPTRKPDIDNVAKIIADSLNKLAYDDDSQITEMRIRKYYSEKPRVEVRITEEGSVE